jgi:hypothetical protein
MRSPVTISLDTQLLAKVEEQRGDVSRSRFIERILEPAVGVPAESPESHEFKCSSSGCDFSAPSRQAICPAHGRKVK